MAIADRIAAIRDAIWQQTTIAAPLGLTGREEAVASLVARGYTNKEVGAELLLTAKAVGYHLGHIFAKLGVNSRRELRGLHTVS